MNVGDYVRAKNGEIGKLVNVELYYVLGHSDKDKYCCVQFNNSFIPCLVSNDFITKKGRIIDIIQIGDYVNGEKVCYLKGDIEKSEVANEEDVLYTEYNDEYGEWYGFAEDKIESIVTHEQFVSMEYKVSD